MDKLISLMMFVIPKFSEIAKNQILIGIGCSGGQHRSVAIAETIYEQLKDKYHCYVWHRDIDKVERSSLWIEILILYYWWWYRFIVCFKRN